MSDSSTRLLRQHVETWRRADAELSRLKQQELQNVDTRKAVWQLFGENTLVQDAPKLRDSGFVEQQAGFAKLREMVQRRGQACRPDVSGQRRGRR